MPRLIALGGLRPRFSAGADTAKSLLRWWLGELRALAPQPLLRFLADTTPPLRLRLGADGTLAAEDGTAPAALAVAGRNRTVELIVPRAAVLRRSIPLPVSAERELHAALRFEIDRQTPFAAETVFYASRVVARDKRRGTLQAELTVAQRQRIEAALAAAREHGAAPDAVVIDGDRGVGRPNLLPHAHRRRGRPWRAEPWKFLAAGASALLLLGPLALAWHLRGEAQALDRDVAGLRALAARGERLEASIAAADAARRFLPEQEARPRAIEMVDMLSRLLPSDSWVFDLELDNREVRIAGFSRNVPGVIEALEKAPLLETPQLRSPVAHTPGASADRFDISARIRGGAS